MTTAQLDTPQNVAQAGRIMPAFYLKNACVWVKHVPLDNGAQEAIVCGREGGEMTDAEWQEYCQMTLEYHATSEINKYLRRLKNMYSFYSDAGKDDALIDALVQEIYRVAYVCSRY